MANKGNNLNRIPSKVNNLDRIPSKINNLDRIPVKVNSLDRMASKVNKLDSLQSKETRSLIIDHLVRKEPSRTIGDLPVSKLDLSLEVSLADLQTKDTPTL